MKGRLPSSLGDVCDKAGGRGTILWEHSNLCERTLGSAGRRSQASCARPCQLTLDEEFLNDPKIQIEFLLGWVRHIHMRSGLGETSPNGEFSQAWICRGRLLYPLSTRGRRYWNERRESNQPFLDFWPSRTYTGGAKSTLRRIDGILSPNRIFTRRDLIDGLKNS